MTASKTAALHALKVAATIAGSVILTGLGVWFGDPSNIALFGKYLGHYGIPMAIVNIIVAALLKYIKEKSTVQTVTVTPLPDATIPPQQ